MGITDVDPLLYEFEPAEKCKTHQIKNKNLKPGKVQCKKNCDDCQNEKSFILNRGNSGFCN